MTNTQTNPALTADPSEIGRPWMRAWLRAAALYNIIWGAAVVLFPNATLRLLGVTPDQLAAVTPPIWQCVGMIVGVYGLGYWIAAAAPLRHWPIVLVGFLGKIFGPIGFAFAVLVEQTVPPTFGLTILTNDLLWWIPFALILWAAFRTEGGRRPLTDPEPDRSPEDALARATTTAGPTLAELSRDATLAVVFLRHFGCTFCREMAADLAAARPELERRGVRLALAHTDPSDDHARAFAARHNLDDLPRTADPDGRLYDALGFRRGSFAQLFGLRVWIRGFVAGLLRRHGVGPLRGDGFRLPGAVLVRDGRVVADWRAQHAAQRLDACRLADRDPAGAQHTGAHPTGHTSASPGVQVTA